MSGARRAGPPPSAPERLTTGRLVLTRPVAADVPEIERLLGDPRVGAWLGGTMAPNAARAAFAAWAAHWDAHGWGMWVARDPRSGVLAGRGGPQLSLNDGEPCVEVGWIVVPQRWGEGLATDIGRASLETAADALAVREVVAKTLPDNAASRRVMEKLGLREERDLGHRGLRHVLYRGPTTPGPAAAPGA